MAARPKKKVTKPREAPQRRHYKANLAVRKKVGPRMKFLVKEFGGTTAFARRHSLDPKYVYRWTHQGMVPNTDTLIQFAVTSNISPDWVLFGRGHRFINGRKPKLQAA